MRANLLLLAIASLLLPSLVRAQAVKPIPWNGHKGALSLSFDDGLPVHLDVAIPELDKRGLRGSFFLIVDSLSRIPEWTAAQKEGHELGNHSVSHQQAQYLNEIQIHTEVDQAKIFLQDNFGKPMLDYAYPEGFYTTSLYSEVAIRTFIARSVSGNGKILSDERFYVPATGPVDWYDVSAHDGGFKCDGAGSTPCPVETYKEWMDTAIKKQSWTGILFHAIGNSAGYNPVPLDTFKAVLDCAKSKEGDLWIAPFVEVGAYLKAMIILNAVKAITRPPYLKFHPDQKKDNWAFYWDTDPIYPTGVIVKVMITLPEGYTRVSQEEKTILPNADGSYTISMDPKVLMLSPTE
jgi:Polysaccharide deacetylase